MILPTEILENIVLISDDHYVAKALKNHISDYIFWKISQNTLIYGEVQSGKTKAIISVLKMNSYKNCKKILVIQNSLLVLSQYEQRLKKENIDYQIIEKDTQKIEKDVILLINNTYRYKKAEKLLQNEKFILLMDEADLVHKNCPLKSNINYYITATPYKMKIKFDNTIKLEKPKNYYGISEIDKKIETNFSDRTENEIIEDFLEEKTGIMLINKYSTLSNMNKLAHNLAQHYSHIPIVVLNSYKYLYLNKKITYCKHKSVNKLIDSLNKHSHIIIIADRCANRGLSFTSSDYSRHLTHQIINIKNNVTGFLQSLRIFGIYKPEITLKIYIDDKQQKLFEKYVKFIQNYKI